MIDYIIATQYTETPGPRYVKEGTYSGEDFRDSVLKNLLNQAKNENKRIMIDFDGGYGYPTSFLEEAFGGLVRDTKDKKIANLFEFKSDEEPALIDEVKLYISEAIKALK